MKFVKSEKILSGKFINRYDITYVTENNNEKKYEIISRDKDISSLEDLYLRPVDAVVIIAHNKAGDKVLLNKEFRLAVGEVVYNFPAGLIDSGEDAATAAVRELKEETGLDLISIEDTMTESYSAVGFSNEKNICIVGIAEGEFAPSTSDVEEIEASWYTKEEVKELLNNPKVKFAARSQAYCYLWSKM